MRKCRKGLAVILGIALAEADHQAQERQIDRYAVRLRSICKHLI